MGKDSIMKIVKQEPGILQSEVRKRTSSNGRMFLALVRDGELRREPENNKYNRSFKLYPVKTKTVLIHGTNALYQTGETL